MYRFQRIDMQCPSASHNNRVMARLSGFRIAQYHRLIRILKQLGPCHVRSCPQEARCRTDLIRFGKYTSSDYLWQWKAGVQEGAGTDDKYCYLPIPEAEYSVNPELQKINNAIGF